MVVLQIQRRQRKRPDIDLPIKHLEILNTKNYNKDLLDYFIEHLEDSYSISEEEITERLEEKRKGNTNDRNNSKYALTTVRL